MLLLLLLLLLLLPPPPPPPLSRADRLADGRNGRERAVYCV
jgi:hypothetical protein